MAKVLVSAGCDLKLSFLVRAPEHQGEKLAKDLAYHLRSRNHNPAWFVDAPICYCDDDSKCMVHGPTEINLLVTIDNVKFGCLSIAATHYSNVAQKFVNSWKVSLSQSS